MTYMSGELASQRRIVNSTENHFDLVETVGKDYLEIDEPGAEGAGVAKKRIGRPPNVNKAGHGRAKPDANPDKERKKPGPAKGWKRNLDPNAPRTRRPYKKKEKVGGVKVDPDK